MRRRLAGLHPRRPARAHLRRLLRHHGLRPRRAVHRLRRTRPRLRGPQRLRRLQRRLRFPGRRHRPVERHHHRHGRLPQLQLLAPGLVHRGPPLPPRRRRGRRGPCGRAEHAHHRVRGVRPGRPRVRRLLLQPEHDDGRSQPLRQRQRGVSGELQQWPPRDRPGGHRHGGPGGAGVLQDVRRLARRLPGRVRRRVERLPVLPQRNGDCVGPDLRPVHVARGPGAAARRRRAGARARKPHAERRDARPRPRLGPPDRARRRARPPRRLRPARPRGSGRV